MKKVKVGLYATVSASLVLAGLGFWHTPAKYFVFDHIVGAANFPEPIADLGSSIQIDSVKVSVLDIRTRLLNYGSRPFEVSKLLAEPELSNVNAALAGLPRVKASMTVVEWRGVSVSDNTAIAQWVEHDAYNSAVALDDNFGRDSIFTANLVKLNGVWMLATVDVKGLTPQFDKH